MSTITKKLTPQLLADMHLYVEYGKPVVEACYDFEGDGFLAPFLLHSITALLLHLKVS